VENHLQKVFKMENTEIWSKWNMPQLWESGEHVLTKLSHNNAGLLTTKIVGTVGTQLNLKDSSIQYNQYEYDNAGHINGIYRNPVWTGNLLVNKGEEVYRYDNMDRLISAEKWRQNPNGNYGQIIRDTLFTATYNKNLMTSNSAIGNYFTTVR
jgi:hypothetical protein